MSFFEKLLSLLLGMSPHDRDQASENLERILQGPHAREFVNDLSKRVPTDRESLARDLSQLLKEPDFRSILKNMVAIQDEMHPRNSALIRRTKKFVFESIFLYTNSAKNADKFKPDGETFLVTVPQGQLVYVNFSGLGSETKGDHPAIVWEASRKRDHILVIPFTSYKPESTTESPNTINIGPMIFVDKATGNRTGFLGVDSIVQLDQMQSVSRKRIRTYKAFNPQLSRPDISTLTTEQITRIKEGMEIYLLGTKSLYQAEIQNYSDMIPYFPDHNAQFKHLHRRYTVIENHLELLKYQIAGDPNVYALHRFPTVLPKKDLSDKLYEWTHACATQTESAENRRKHYHTQMQTFIQQAQRETN